jgi:hypothetical protein
MEVQELNEKEEIHKRIILKNWSKYACELPILKTVLDKQEKETFTKKEVKKLVKDEMERVIK